MWVQGCAVRPQGRLHNQLVASTQGRTHLTRAPVYYACALQGLSVQVWRKYEDFIKELSGEVLVHRAAPAAVGGSSSNRRVLPLCQASAASLPDWH